LQTSKKIFFVRREKTFGIRVFKGTPCLIKIDTSPVRLRQDIGVCLSDANAEHTHPRAIHLLPGLAGAPKSANISIANNFFAPLLYLVSGGTYAGWSNLDYAYGRA
jgi:hypothetical protein